MHKHMKQPARDLVALLGLLGLIGILEAGARAN
jgi:hypothetical protein